MIVNFGCKAHILIVKYQQIFPVCYLFKPKAITESFPLFVSQLTVFIQVCGCIHLRLTFWPSLFWFWLNFILYIMYIFCILFRDISFFSHLSLDWYNDWRVFCNPDIVFYFLVFSMLDYWKISKWFIIYHRVYLKNHWTNHMLVCTHFDIFAMLIANNGLTIEQFRCF